MEFGLMFGIEKDLQQLMEQVYGPLGKKEREESARIAKQIVDNAVQKVKKMTENEEEIEKVKAEIKVLEKKLSFLVELEQTKTPVEEAFKDNYGVYPNELKTTDDFNCWKSFKRGYNAAQKDYKVGEFQVPAKDTVSLYRRFVNEGAYGMTSFENALKVVNDFLLDEGVIEDESGEYITFTLQKSLLDTPND
jgi:ribosomal protein L23